MKVLCQGEATVFKFYFFIYFKFVRETCKDFLNASSLMEAWLGLGNNNPSIAQKAKECRIRVFFNQYL